MFQLFSVLGGLAQSWITGKVKEVELKQEVKLRNIAADGNWEVEQAKAAATSWKDEWFTICLSIPMVLAFFPPAIDLVMDGFRVLNQMPEYYKAFLGAAIAASFGLKSVAEWRK